MYTVVKHLEERQKEVLKDSILVSEIRKLHILVRKQWCRRKSGDKFPDNKKPYRKSLDTKKVELELETDLEESFSEDIGI